MSERSSIFVDEWRKCLNEHYKYVIREQDKVTEETLTPIMHQVGYTDEDLGRLYVEATMDDTSKTPDMNRAMSAVEDTMPNQPFHIHPAECQCAACMDTVLDIGHDEDGQPLSEPEEPQEAQGNIFVVEKPQDADSDEDSPRQISLF